MTSIKEDVDGLFFKGRGILDRIERFTSKGGKEFLTLIVRIDGQYPQLIPIKVFGRTVEDAKDMEPGARLEVSGKLGGRDWNGRIYGDIIGLHVHAVGEAKQDAPAPKQQELPPPPKDEDIPF